MNGSRTPARTRTLTPVLVGLMAMSLGATNDAMAQGYSTDIELVRPVFSHKLSSGARLRCARWIVSAALRTAAYRCRAVAIRAHR